MKIHLIEYGAGNLGSILHALQWLGYSASIIDEPTSTQPGDMIILPGVGSFAAAMENLHARNLVSWLKEEAALSRTIIGVCLGMQLLASVGEEDGENTGLDLIPGRITRLPESPFERIPNIGFRQIQPSRPTSLLDGILPAHQNFYFLHSYHFVPEEPSSVLAYSLHGDFSFVAAIKSANVTGFQFHPEKSQGSGLYLLKNLLESNGAQ